MEYKELIKKFPNDINCAFCGRKNDWDEDGFFYLWTRPHMSFEDGQAACKECREGEPGRLHKNLHGEGER